MKKVIWAIIVIVAVVLIVLGLQNNNRNEDTIRIGFIGPLTGDGAAWGEIEKNTIQLAVNEINESGGINGRLFEVTYEDGKCEGSTGLSAAKKLVEIDGIDILFISCSQEIIPIAPYTQSKGVIAWTSYASASNISNLGDLVFRNSYTNNDMSKAIADIVIGKGNRAAIISEQSAFASDLRDLFVNNYKSMGGEITANENYEQDGRDFRTQLTRIISSNPDVVVINPNGPDSGIAIIQQLRQMGYEGDFVGNFFGGSRQVQETPEAEGMVYVSDPVFSESPLKKKVFEKYEKMYGQTPDLPWPVGARYDAVYLLKQAIESVGDKPTDIARYLHNLPEDFTGVLGTYRFEANTPNITNVKPTVAIIKNGKTELLK